VVVPVNAAQALPHDVTPQPRSHNITRYVTCNMMTRTRAKGGVPVDAVQALPHDVRLTLVALVSDQQVHTTLVLEQRVEVVVPAEWAANGVQREVIQGVSMRGAMARYTRPSYLNSVLKWLFLQGGLGRTQETIVTCMPSHNLRCSQPSNTPSALHQQIKIRKEHSSESHCSHLEHTECSILCTTCHPQAHLKNTAS
jgi:hypothetical protein